MKNDLRVKEKFNLKKFLLSWEMILVYVLILINIILMIIKPNVFFSKGTITAIIRSGMDLSIMVLGMVFILLLGEIDVSVGSIMILSCTVMGEIYNATSSSALTLCLGILTGGVCGLINGILVAKNKIPSVIVTIATALIFKGIVEVVLERHVLSEFPNWFFVLAWDDIIGIPFSLLYFLGFALIFAIVMHKTKFGRELYLIGSNKKVAKYSGLRVELIVIITFVIMGITAALSGVIFVGRLNGISPSVATGYELRVIAIAVLGGVSTKGGKGKMVGPIIATLVVAFLCKTLDLIGVQANVQKIFIGVILIISVIIPIIKNKVKGANENA